MTDAFMEAYPPPWRMTATEVLARNSLFADFQENWKELEEAIKEGSISIEEGGALHGSYDYLHWEVGTSSAGLDGSFTAKRLKAIAAYMENPVH